jgi:Gram-negative bacterial TonB protein C-terminal
MKKIIYCFIVLFLIQYSFSQTAVYEVPKTPLTYDLVEVRPEFPGGYLEFLKFISSNYKLPEVESLSGAVKVSFVIDELGKITNIKVIKDLGNGTGEEAIRVLKMCPKWLPGENENQKVSVAMTIPINIQI